MEKKNLKALQVAKLHFWVAEILSQEEDRLIYQEDFDCEEEAQEFCDRLKAYAEHKGHSPFRFVISEYWGYIHKDCYEYVG